MSLESFKTFVRNKPGLADYVTKKEMSWQDFYNLYELYGENHSIWNKYTTEKVVGASSSAFSFKDMLGMFKNIDMNEVQKGIGSLQKGIGYLQNMVESRNKTTSESKKPSYEPRPMYKYFDD